MLFLSTLKEILKQKESSEPIPEIVLKVAKAVSEVFPHAISGEMKVEGPVFVADVLSGRYNHIPEVGMFMGLRWLGAEMTARNQAWLKRSV